MPIGFGIRVPLGAYDDVPLHRGLLEENFLLSTNTAAELFHGSAEKQPIFDFHNHLPVRDIAEHRQYRDLTELWLEHDHYKWRVMRANGVDERFITGSASPYEKFEAFAAVMPRLVGCPVYHWTRLELDRYFNIGYELNPQNAERIWDRTRELLREPGYDAVSLLAKMNVKVLCTTDDPADTLEWHRIIARDDSIPFKVCPSFRPDRFINGCDREAEAELCGRYGAGVDAALLKALDFFAENGALASDHGFIEFPYLDDPAFAARLRLLGAAYKERGIVMQMHFGPVRNTNPKLYAAYGPDAGADSCGRSADPFALAAFLGDLAGEDLLPKSVIYNLNPADNRVFSTMAVNFAPRVQYGAAWWFSDTISGMRAQITELMETGALASSTGMLTDSRSVTAFVRHEYYRRILCGMLGELVENGEYPNDIETLKQIVADVCYNNAERFFTGGKYE